VNGIGFAAMICDKGDSLATGRPLGDDMVSQAAKASTKPEASQPRQLRITRAKPWPHR
jgi:hypothetical protein